MTASILVAYATKSGSTKEVAEVVASALNDASFPAEVRRLPVKDGLEGYRAVVLGAPLYMFHWHKDALHFLGKHREALSRLPVAVFALGPINDVEKERVEARGQLDKALAELPWFLPAAVVVFGGKFDPGALRLPYSLIPAMKKLPASDIRDWDAIRAWAEALPEQFGFGEDRP